MALIPTTTDSHIFPPLIKSTTINLSQSTILSRNEFYKRSSRATARVGGQSQRSQQATERQASNPFSFIPLSPLIQTHQIPCRLSYLYSVLSIYFHEKPNVVMDLSDIAKNHQVRKKYTVQLGENELVLKVFLTLLTCFPPRLKYLLVYSSVARRGSRIRDFF